MSGPQFINTRKVIPREEFGVVDEGTQYTEEARRVYQSVQEYAERTESEARERGYQEGFEQARQETFALMEETIREAKERLFVLEDMLTPVVIAAVEKIIGSMDDHVLVRRVLREALIEAGQSMSVTLRVAPEDLDEVRMVIEDISQQRGLAEIEAVKPDAILKEGEMILETAQGRVHIGLTQQLQRLRSGLYPGSGH